VSVLLLYGCNTTTTIQENGNKLANGLYTNIGHYSSENNFTPFDSIKLGYQNILKINNDSIINTIKTIGTSCEVLQQISEITITKDSICFGNTRERKRIEKSCTNNWEAFIEFIQPCYGIRNVTGISFEFEPVNPVNLKKEWIAFTIIK
jgi:hypothetical protein